MPSAIFWDSVVVITAFEGVGGCMACSMEITNINLPPSDVYCRRAGSQTCRYGYPKTDICLKTVAAWMALLGDAVPRQTVQKSIKRGKRPCSVVHVPCSSKFALLV